MASYGNKIDKLLGKVKKAQSSIKSFRGTLAKLSTLAKGTDLDLLGEQAEKARQTLAERRSQFEGSALAKNRIGDITTKTDRTVYNDLIYPVTDILDNYLVFTIHPRKNQKTITSKVFGESTDDVKIKQNGNVMSEGRTEIMLHIPDGLASTMNVSYNTNGIGVGSEFLNQLMQGGFSEAFDAGKEMLDRGSLALLRTLGGGDIEALRQGYAINPNETQLLEGIPYREFSFEYDFQPKSPEEAQMVLDIIYTFRSAMLPDTFNAGTAKTNAGFFNYPNKFTLDFEGPIKKFVDGFMPMVCTKCDVAVGGDQKFSTFETGQPVRYVMSIAFTEIVMMTQEGYTSGGNSEVVVDYTEGNKDNKRLEQGDLKKIGKDSTGVDFRI
tara:strand:+ start:3395 stop:4540 length:1146 start_codon:yes stop_codon:yes gene_type:complete